MKFREWEGRRSTRRSKRKSRRRKRIREERKRSIEENMRSRKVQRTGVKYWRGPPKGKGEAAHCILDI